MQAHGASAGGAALWSVAVAIGLYMFLIVRSGAPELSSARLDRQHHPARFWALVGTMIFAEAALLWGGWFLATHSRPHFSVM
jgi:hypothetical protein